MPDNANQNPNPTIDGENPPVGEPGTSGEPGQDDLSTLFTPEEVTAKKEAVAASKVEEDRRAKLTPDELKAEDKAKADLEASNGVPEKYEIKIPDGMEVDKAMLEEATPMFKELGLSQEKAQKVIDFYSTKVLPAFVKRSADTWNAQKESWAAEVKKDQEIGGTKFDASVKSAQRVLNTLGTDALKKVFDEYGLGNHPEFVRVFARMATHLKEDTIETGDKNLRPTGNTMEGIATVLYDNTPPQGH